MVQVKRREATLNGWNRGHYSDRLEGISLFHFSSSALIHFHRNDQGPTSHTVSSDKTSFNRPQRHPGLTFTSGPSRAKEIKLGSKSLILSSGGGIFDQLIKGL